MLVLNDQGGSQMSVSEDIVGTMRTQEHGHQSLVFENTKKGAFIMLNHCEKILGISVSVNDSKLAMERIFSDKSLESLSLLSKIGTLLINFRFPAWDKNSLWECLSKLEKFKIPVRYTVNKQDFQGRGLPPLNLMRSQSISLMNCQFYVFLNENFLLEGGDSSKRNAGLQILDAIHFLLKNPDFGVVSFKQRLGKNLPKLSDGNICEVPFDVSVENSSGLVLKNVSEKSSFKGLIPSEALSSYGAGDDLVTIAHVLSFGYKQAILSKSRISSVLVDDLGASVRAVMEINNCKVIKDLFNPNYSFTDKGANLVFGKKIENKEDFYEKALKINYSDFPLEEEIYQILSMANGNFSFENKGNDAFGVCENAEAAFLMKESHTSLTTGGGKPGQGYPCVLQNN